jgi:hypothetical protein
LNEILVIIQAKDSRNTGIQVREGSVLEYRMYVTALSTVLNEKLLVEKLVKKSPTFYESYRFSAMSTGVCH